MGLFDPVWKTMNEKKLDKAIAFVQKVKDPSGLVEIARWARLEEVQDAALDRMPDQAMLADVAMEGSGYDYSTKAALERITDLSLLDKLARGAEDVTVRWAALYRMVELDRNVDLVPYDRVIAGGVRAANEQMLALCDDLALMEDVCRQRGGNSWFKEEERRIRERANEVALKRVETSSDRWSINKIADNSFLTYSVREAARKKLVSLAIAKCSTQQEIFEAACSDPDIRDQALSRLTDEGLLCKAIERLATFSSGCDLADHVRRISDETLLERIANNESLGLKTRYAAASKAGFDPSWRASFRLPSGFSVLMCDTCGDIVRYAEDFNTEDASWGKDGWFYCGHGHAGGGPRRTSGHYNAPSPVSVVENPGPITAKELVYLCPACLRLRRDSPNSCTIPRCTCAQESRYPVVVPFSPAEW